MGRKIRQWCIRDYLIEAVTKFQFLVDEALLFLML